MITAVITWSVKENSHEKSLFPDDFGDAGDSCDWPNVDLSTVGPESENNCYFL